LGDVTVPEKYLQETESVAGTQRKNTKKKFTKAYIKD
jgi:hypothetical protein